MRPDRFTLSLPHRARRFLTGLRAELGSDGIALRQLEELQKQILSLYALLSVNTCTLAFTFYTLAPDWLALGVPGVLVPLGMFRAFQWRRLKLREITEAQAVRHLQLTTLLTVPLSVAFVAWAIALDPYGGPLEQGHVTIFVAVTVVACIFCLTHLPVAAFLVTAIVIGAFLYRCFTGGNDVSIAIALNVAFVTIVMVRILAGNFIAFVQLVHSQAETQRLSEENARLAMTDSLTELPNRRFFFGQLDAMMRDSSTQAAPFGLAIFDLDRFKPINDTYGHNVGDRVLAETGLRLSAFAGPDVTITRLGGDEFGVLLRAPGSPKEAIALCDDICMALHMPIRLGDIEVAIGCSGGLALYPSAGRSANALFDRADYSLYHSKEGRRGVTTLFSQEHEDAIREKRAVEAALQSADLAAEMEVHYQPIVDIETGGIVGVEGLARWTSPTLGRIPPNHFIAAAERTGTIHALTVLLLGKALADAARIPPEIELSFNLSSHDLASSETVIAIVAAVRKSGLDPRRLTLELTETALMRDFERAKESIDLLHALGIRIALDDFGTGYSSLSYVHRLPLDKIKIDRSFVADLGSELGHSVITTILDLCRSLGLEGIVEGVETPEQFEALRRYGCRYVQGYLVGRPMPIGNLLVRLAEPGTLPREKRSAM